LILKKKTILLVEDDTLVSLSIKHILEKNRFSVVCAYNGDDAISLIGKDNTEIHLGLLNYGKIKERT